MIGSAVLLCACCIVSGLLLVRGKDGAAAPSKLVYPDQPLPQYRFHLRWIESDREVAVSEEIAFTLNETEELDRLCLRCHASAYLSLATSPVATDDLIQTAYPDGFDEAALILEGCWVNDRLTEAHIDSAQPELLWLRASISPEESTNVLLRFRLKLPTCASLFGYSTDALRLVQVFPVLARRDTDAWDTGVLMPYASPQGMEASDVQITTDFPDAWQVIAGACRGTYDVSVLAMPVNTASVSGRAGHIRIDAFSAGAGRAQQLLMAAQRILPIYERHYGHLPWDEVRIVALSIPDTGCSFPGLILINDELADSQVEHELAYWLAGQWFGSVMYIDEVQDAWLVHAARQWARLRYIQDAYGAEEEQYYRRLWTALPMQENLHAAVTPGMSADAFPDLATYRSVMDGRAAAMLYAVDLMLDGRLDAFLSHLVAYYSFQRVGRAEFISQAQQLYAIDCSPLLTDWLDTLMTTESS